MTPVRGRLKAILITVVVAGVVALSGRQAVLWSEFQEAVQTVDFLSGLLRWYANENDGYPGLDFEDDIERRHSENTFPRFFEALRGDLLPLAGVDQPSRELLRQLEGGAVVESANEGQYRRASLEELQSAEVDKWILDPWGEPYIYRPHIGHNESGVIYSKGPDRQDQTLPFQPGSDDDDIVMTN